MNYGSYITFKNSHFQQEITCLAVNLVRAEMLIGNDIYNKSNEDIGDIKEIIFDANTGSIVYVVLSFGSFLGWNERLFPVPWNALTVDNKTKRFILNIDKYSLQDAPAFQKKDWPDWTNQAWLSTIHSYYGISS